MEKTKFTKEFSKLRKFNNEEFINWKIENFSHLTTKQKNRVKVLENKREKL